MHKFAYVLNKSPAEDLVSKLCYFLPTIRLPEDCMLHKSSHISPKKEVLFTSTADFNIFFCWPALAASWSPNFKRELKKKNTYQIKYISSSLHLFNLSTFKVSYATGTLCVWQVHWVKLFFVPQRKKRLGNKTLRLCPWYSYAANPMAFREQIQISLLNALVCSLRFQAHDVTRDAVCLIIPQNEPRYRRKFPTLPRPSLTCSCSGTVISGGRF